MLDFSSWDYMAKKIDSLSVFFPTYNEEKTIQDTVIKAKNVLEKIVNKWEIIVVNDGSTDRTAETVEKIIQDDSRVRIITHSPNRGYGAALKTGFYNSRYSWIAFTDSDGQFDFKEITEFIKKQEETRADLVIGYYLERKVSFGKKITSRMWEFLVNLLFGLKIKDIDCGFKLISKEVIDKIPKLESERGAFISSELLIKAKKSGFKIAEIGVTHYPRKAGKGTGRNLNVVIKSFIDLIKLWRKL